MYLQDILVAMARIAEYLEGYDFDQFKKDYKTLDAVIRNFEIIGEASRRLPDHINKNNSDLPWDEMYLLRNKVSHEYFGIEYEIIWDICINHLAENRKQIQSILNNL